MFRLTWVLFTCGLAVAQPTFDLMDRVLMVQSKFYTGTIFSIDVDGREYWITAKHIITGAGQKPFGVISDKKVELKLLNPGGEGKQWLPFAFTIVPIATDGDIVVLVPSKLILDKPLPSPSSTSVGIMLGGKCQFLGFPFGGGWRATFEKGEAWLPFVKSCTVSGQGVTDRMWVLDGINNKGFSGGPVIIGTGPQLQIIGVISGYATEPTDVIRAGAKADVPKDTVNLNSGFIFAYDIGLAVDVIKKNPLGPQRLAVAK